MDLQQLDTISTLEQLHNRKMSSVESLTYFLERIERHNTAVNAVVTKDIEQAMAKAKAADEARANGESIGRLHGLPMTIKDTFEVVGMTATAGANSLKYHHPNQDSVVARRLQDAGAIIFGKTNTPPYAMDVQTYNDLFGVTNNPWNLAHTAGGSSGGSAAALAAGFTTLEMGSDIGGSIRTPAHFCGVYGHKPTHGVVPMHGHIPGPLGTKGHPDLAVAGPLGRSAKDLALGLSLIAGSDSLNATGWQLKLPKPRHHKLSDFRIAVWLDDENCSVDSEVIQVLETAVSTLITVGAQIKEAKPAELNEILGIYYTLLASFTGASLPKSVYQQYAEVKNDLASYQAKFDLPDAFLTHVAGRTASHRQWLGANEKRAKMQYQLQAFFNEFDVLLTPVTPMAAPLHNNEGSMEARKVLINGEKRPYVDHFPWIALATMAGLPATSAPIGFTKSGLPVNIQIIGPYLEDYTPIKFAELLAKTHGGAKFPNL
ncbi:MAG: amidase [Chloroflexota bacterium]